jgi:hypothetical protein
MIGRSRCFIEYGGNDCEFERCPDTASRLLFMHRYLAEYGLLHVGHSTDSLAGRAASQLGRGELPAEFSEHFMKGLDVSARVSRVRFCVNDRCLTGIDLLPLTCLAFDVGHLGHHSERFLSD